MPRKLTLLNLFGAISLCFYQSTAFAQTNWPPVLFNPKPAENDFILPLPCQGAVVFRKIIIPAQNILDDLSFKAGGGDEEWQFSESPYDIFISGGFSDADGSRSYYMAKYELNQMQYKAVMEDDCPKPAPNLRLPQANLSWGEAILFSDRLNHWLLENARDRLPKEDESYGYVRLPTEAEWDFAARGGIKVSDTELRDRIFPMDGALSDYVWFRGSESANGKVQMIGLTKANPLGLYDMLGNLDEMILEPFRLSRGDRLHGHSGGFIVRGGNFKTAKEDIRTSHRVEFPHYGETGATRLETTGFRLVLNAQALTSLQRVADIREETDALGFETTPAEGASEHSAFEQLDKLNDEIEDENIRLQIANLKSDLRNSNIERDEQRNRAAKATLRLGAFLCRKLKNDVALFERSLSLYTSNRCDTESPSEYCPARTRHLENNRIGLAENLEYYSDTIVNGSIDFSENTLKEQFNVLKQQFTARGQLKLIDYADIFRAQLQEYALNGRITRDDWLESCKAGP